MLSIRTGFYKYILLGIIFISQIFIVINAYARDVTLMGKVINPVSSEVRPVIRVYLPGVPFHDDYSNEWRLLAETTYNKTTGDYSVVVDVPDNENNVVLSATYLTPEFDVTSWVNVADNIDVITDIDLPTTKNNDLSFVFKILISGQEFNYIENSASCMILTKDEVRNGRLMLMGVYDAWLHKFTGYGFPNGVYRVACSIQNVPGISVGNQVPSVLKRYKDITLPVSNQEKIINFDFSESSTDGNTY